MNCLAMLDSGNYVFRLCRNLERKGYTFEVVSIPCKIARQGCGYCLKFPEEYLETVVGEGRQNGIPVREVFRIVYKGTRNDYVKVI